MLTSTWKKELWICKVKGIAAKKPSRNDLEGGKSRGQVPVSSLT